MARDANGKIQRTATGTGPLTWYHDQTPSGIADLKGNVWEWSGGIRTVYGELQILTNNNGANALNSQGASSDDWKAIKASDGSLIAPNGSGTTSGSVKMDFVSSKLKYDTSISDASPGQHSCTFANIECASSIGDATKLLLAELGLMQYGGNTELFSGETVYFNNGEAERCFSSGGNWGHAASGMASFHGSYARSLVNTHVGFRSAYIKLPSA